MARKTKKEQNMPKSQGLPDNVEILSAGEVLENSITDTLRENYMPYAMSVIVSRALPEIDGLKPSHRKLLYTMYDMGLLKGAKTKSANIVGQTMRLNPHGDQAIYETMCVLHEAMKACLYLLWTAKVTLARLIQGIWHMPHPVTQRQSWSRYVKNCSVI